MGHDRCICVICDDLIAARIRRQVLDEVERDLREEFADGTVAMKSVYARIARLRDKHEGTP